MPWISIPIVSPLTMHHMVSLSNQILVVDKEEMMDNMDKMKWYNSSFKGEKTKQERKNKIKQK